MLQGPAEVKVEHTVDTWLEKTRQYYVERSWVSSTIVGMQSSYLFYATQASRRTRSTTQILHSMGLNSLTGRQRGRVYPHNTLDGIVGHKADENTV